MKFKTTKKEMNRHYSTILRVSYSSLQSLLRYLEPFAYSTRIEGWACDYYKVNDVIISTGYAPIGIVVNYDLIKEYEKKAEAIVFNNYTEAEEIKREKIESLLNEFIAKVVK